MAIAALEQILEWSVEQVAANLAEVTSDIARSAADLGLAPLPDDQRGPHLLGVRLPDGVRERVLPALAERNCFAAVRGSSLRVSPHLHVSADDVERLLDALALALDGRPAA